jgi:O-antigen ligase
MFYSAFRAWTVENGLNNFRRYFVPQIVAFIVAYRGFEKSEDYSRFLLFFVILLIIIGTFTFWDLFFDRWILKSGKLHDKIYWGSRKNGRFGSLFLNPNYMGAFAVLTIPVVFIRALVEKETGKRIFCWLGVLALVFAFIETQSRGPMLGILVALFFFIVVPVKRFSFAKKVSYLLLLLAVLYLFMPGFFTHSTERFSMIDKETSDDHKSRYSVWEYTVEIIKEYPFFGVGLGEVQYKKYMYKFGFRSEFLERPLDNAHNSYLQIAVHAGIPAVLIFILINILLVKRGIFAVSGYGEREISLYLLGLIAGLLGFLACLIPDMFMFTATVGPSYWVMTGLIFSIINYQKRFVEE